jgi:CheY-like chemotaxis protein
MKILFVEDDPEARAFVSRALRESGFVVDTASDAESGIALASVGAYDVLILDVKLPGMSGLEFLGLQVVRDAGVPIVVVSGYVTEDQARECLRLGALEFLAKPVPLQVLGTVLEHMAILTDPSGEPQPPRDRRLAARVPVTLPLRATTEQGPAAAGAVIEVSATGLRARLDRPLRPGTAARLAVALPDGGAPLDVLALVVRSDGEHMVAFWFLDLTPGEVDRLLARAHTAH